MLSLAPVMSCNFKTGFFWLYIIKEPITWDRLQQLPETLPQSKWCLRVLPIIGVQIQMKFSPCSSFNQHLSFSCQSFASDSWGVGSGSAASEAVSSGSAQQMAADTAVFCNTPWSGGCLFSRATLPIPVHTCLLMYWFIVFSSPSFFTYQMKQSLEKLHSGVGVPELQHDAPDEPPAETQAEDWVSSGYLSPLLFPSWST